MWSTSSDASLINKVIFFILVSVIFLNLRGSKPLKINVTAWSVVPDSALVFLFFKDITHCHLYAQSVTGRRMIEERSSG